MYAYHICTFLAYTQGRTYAFCHKFTKNGFKMILKGIENVHIFLVFVHILEQNPYHIFCTLAGSPLGQLPIYLCGPFS